MLLLLEAGLNGKGDSTGFYGGSSGVYNSDNTSTWQTTSDARIKKNIIDNNTGLEKIKQIRVRNFEYRTPEEVDPLYHLILQLINKALKLVLLHRKYKKCYLTL